MTKGSNATAELLTSDKTDNINNIFLSNQVKISKIYSAMSRKGNNQHAMLL